MYRAGSILPTFEKKGQSSSLGEIIKKDSFNLSEGN
jgi:hypothetical protein